MPITDHYCFLLLNIFSGDIYFGRDKLSHRFIGWATVGFEKAESAQTAVKAGRVLILNMDVLIVQSLGMMGGAVF